MYAAHALVRTLWHAVHVYVAHGGGGHAQLLRAPCKQCELAAADLPVPLAWSEQVVVLTGPTALHARPQSCKTTLSMPLCLAHAPAAARAAAGGGHCAGTAAAERTGAAFWGSHEPRSALLRHTHPFRSLKHTISTRCWPSPLPRALGLLAAPCRPGPCCLPLPSPLSGLSSAAQARGSMSVARGPSRARPPIPGPAASEPDCMRDVLSTNELIAVIDPDAGLPARPPLPAARRAP